MKLTKIFTELLKLRDKNETRLRYGIQDGFIYYTPDGNRMFKIPEKEFLIDLTKAFPSLVSLTNVKQLFDDKGTEPAIKTNEMKLTMDGKATVVKFVSEKSYAWVNVKYLDYFTEEVTYKIIGRNKPVFVYEYGNLVGIILPVNMREESDND